ncbi:hypothetical protein PMIN01_05128 [Paraphaeosphaeria minitans]|uniref:Uncharacterized protein n=1 Tax=Paraphaeosphaeria minitans TaxID=565426 RepID=A0A9P6KT43_9PLEO|nr:hypothetical protein PMIN01_05128 [Paraphaeosphaeria minitans]
MASRSERDGGRRGTVRADRNRIVVRMAVWCDAGDGYGYELGLVRAGRSVSQATRGAHQQTHTPPALTSMGESRRRARTRRREAWVISSRATMRCNSLQVQFPVLGGPPVR